jgi:hypothetical protein
MTVGGTVVTTTTGGTEVSRLTPRTVMSGPPCIGPHVGHTALSAGVGLYA